MIHIPFVVLGVAIGAGAVAGAGVIIYCHWTEIKIFIATQIANHPRCARFFFSFIASVVFGLLYAAGWIPWAIKHLNGILQAIWDITAEVADAFAHGISWLKVIKAVGIAVIATLVGCLISELRPGAMRDYLHKVLRAAVKLVRDPNEHRFRDFAGSFLPEKSFKAYNEKLSSINSDVP